ncbi:hypothetical protein LH128_00185 [Sphingomonas sp. LH128]|nr:hypothetical protein LH128_00185 [Sphingomonas sp. LH128]
MPTPKLETDMTTMLERMYETIANMSDEDLALIDRMMDGGFENDLVRRGDISAAVRALRVEHAGDRHYQHALTDLTRKINHLTVHGEGCRQPACTPTHNPSKGD